VTASPADWVTIAVLGKTRGNRGEITAFSLTSRPERFADLEEVFLFGTGQRYLVESTWWHQETLVFKFHGVDSISDAETLTGAEVRIPVTQRVALDPGEYFQSDLIGCEVFDRRTGRSLGLVSGWNDGGGSGLLELEGGTLIPFARSICVEIDPAHRRIAVELPEGLEDINHP
jgi:16S rRNA processing protein RimM